MNINRFLCLLCTFALFTGCEDDPSEVESPNMAGEESVAGEESMAGEESVAGAESVAGEESMAGEEEQTVMIGAPDGDPVRISHDSAITSIRANLTQHIDELDAALDMLEESLVIENIVDLLSDNEEDDNDEEKNDDEPTIEVDLSELRDGIIELLTEDLLAEGSATINDEGNAITYQVSADHVCADDEEEEEEISDEDRAERLREFQDCTRRLEDNPVTIVVSSTGDQKINLSMTVANQPEALRIQIHDDLIAGFIPLQFVKRFIRVFVDEEDLEMPDTMTGLIGLEARRISEAHFSLRASILEDIEITSDESAAVRFQLASVSAPGSLTLNGPSKLIEGQLNLNTINLELPWQEIVNMFYDDEGEYRTECFDNSSDVEYCNNFISNGCLDSCSAESDREVCQERCLESAEDSLQGALRSYTHCVNTILESECPAEDDSCREARCRDTEEFRAMCEHRSWCEEYQEPPEEAPEVEGNLKVFMQALSGSLRFDVNEQTVELQEVTLGDETMTIHVEDAPIIAVDLNPENDRELNVQLSGSDDGHLALQISPLLDVSVALSLDNVWEAFVENRDDLPQVLADDVLNIKFDGSEAPTLETIGTDDELDMRVASGQLSLSSPRMDEAVVIGEGMCMGSEDEDALSEEERDARHELFGLLMSVECSAE